MKKFLSMLLALSVVFTYTFGGAASVFATVPEAPTNDASTYLNNVDKAYKDLTGKLTNTVQYVKDNKVEETTTITYEASPAKTFDLEKAQMNDAVDGLASLVKSELDAWKATMYDKTASDDNGTKYYFDMTTAEIKAIFTTDAGAAYDFNELVDGDADVENVWTSAKLHHSLLVDILLQDILHT